MYYLSTRVDAASLSYPSLVTQDWHSTRFSQAGRRELELRCCYESRGIGHEEEHEWRKTEKRVHDLSGAKRMVRLLNRHSRGLSIFDDYQQRNRSCAARALTWPPFSPLLFGAQSTTGDSVPIVGGLVDTTLNDAMHGPVGSALSGDGSSDSDDIPVVNGLVNRTLEDHHRIPFVDPKDSDESAQSVRSMDVASGPSSPSSPTDAVASPTTVRAKQGGARILRGAMSDGA